MERQRDIESRRNSGQVPQQQFQQQQLNMNKIANWSLGKRYRCIETIGKGSYGQVIKASDRFVIEYFFQLKTKFRFPSDWKTNSLL